MTALFSNLQDGTGRAYFYDLASAPTETGIYERLLTSLIAVTEGDLESWSIFDALADDSLIVSDDAIKGVIASTILTKILESPLTLSDQFVGSSLRNRMIESFAALTDNTLSTAVRGVMAEDSLTLSDEQTLWMLRSRLLGDSVALSDEALAQSSGVIIYERVMESLATVDDSALRFVEMVREALDAIVVADEAEASVTVDRVIARFLESTISVDDEFVKLLNWTARISDEVAVDDALTALFLPWVSGITIPRIVTGFDQTRIKIGGYAI